MTLDEVVPGVEALSLTTLRVWCMLGLLPPLAERRAPRPLVAALALWTALAVTSAAPASGVGEGALLVAALGEVALGALLGATLRLALLPLDAAGELVAAESGLGFPATLDPARAEPAAAAQALLSAFGLLVFLSLDGLGAALRLTASSFGPVPAGAAGALASAPDVLGALPALVAGALRAAVALALPVLITSVVVSAAVVTLSRAVPRLNLLSDLLPLRTVTTLAVTAAALPLAVRVVHEGLDRTCAAAVKLLAS